MPLLPFHQQPWEKYYSCMQGMIAAINTHFFFKLILWTILMRWFRPPPPPPPPIQRYSQSLTKVLCPYKGLIINFLISVITCTRLFAYANCHTCQILLMKRAMRIRGIQVQWDNRNFLCGPLKMCLKIGPLCKPQFYNNICASYKKPIYKISSTRQPNELGPTPWPFQGFFGCQQR